MRTRPLKNNSLMLFYFHPKLIPCKHEIHLLNPKSINILSKNLLLRSSFGIFNNISKDEFIFIAQTLVQHFVTNQWHILKPRLLIDL